MGLEWKIDVLQALKEKGYTTYTLRHSENKEDRLSESTIQKLRNGEGVSWENLESLCRFLDCQPSDLIKYKR